MLSDLSTALRKLMFSPPFDRPRWGNLVGVTWPRLDAYLMVYPFPRLVPTATLPERVWAFKHILSPRHVYFMPRECCHMGPSTAFALYLDLLSAFPPISSIPLVVLLLSLLHRLYMKKVWDLISDISFSRNIQFPKLFTIQNFPTKYNVLDLYITCSFSPFPIQSTRSLSLYSILRTDIWTSKGNCLQIPSLCPY